MDIYRSIPPEPSSFNSNAVIGRIIESLGYRYYWATEGLGDEDLEYRPVEGSRSTLEILEHMHMLSLMILNAPQGGINIRPTVTPDFNFDELRTSTLENLEKASQLIQSDSEEDLAKYKVHFRFGEKQADFPIWNYISGPLTDAISHVGQIASFRRASGNPIHEGVNVFTGKTKE